MLVGLDFLETTKQGYNVQALLKKFKNEMEEM